MNFTRMSCLALLFASTACFGGTTKARSYYVLHGVTTSSMVNRPIIGLVRVRAFNAATIYEKFQVVVRRNPYELQYNEDNVWAVKPNRMISDEVARALAESRRFTAVARELGDLKPEYILAGDLHAIEVYDSGDAWFAHLALSLRLTRYDTGVTLHTFNFDERRPLPDRTFSQAARAISELMSTAMDELLIALETVDAPRLEVAPGETLPPTVLLPDADNGGDTAPTPAEDKEETIYLPESR